MNSVKGLEIWTIFTQSLKLIHQSNYLYSIFYGHKKRKQAVLLNSVGRSLLRHNIPLQTIYRTFFFFKYLTATLLPVTSCKFKPRITFAVKAASSIDTVMVASAIAALTLVYVWEKEAHQRPQNGWELSVVKPKQYSYYCGVNHKENNNSVRSYSCEVHLSASVK